MRKTQLLTTAAAVLLIGTAAVSAQGLKKDEGTAPAPAAQQNAPAEKVAPAMKPGDTQAGAETKKPETTGQAPKEQAPGKAQMQPNANGGTLKDGGDKASDKAGASDAAPASDRNAATKSETKTETKSTTTGQGAAAGSAKLSTEQRTKITGIIRQHKVAPVKLDVAVSVGTRVPASVHFYPLPQEVVVIYPEWRGYDYILVGDQIVIVDPRTHEIVAILEA